MIEIADENLKEAIPNHWFDRGTALKVIHHHFRTGQNLIRIATGFFTVRGYNLIRSSAKNKQMYILVGVDDPGKDRVRKALVQEIMRDLRTGRDVDRRQAVVELVEKLEGGQFRIIDARAKDHHAKLFIVDETVVLVGSSNVSQRGMLDAIEAGNIVTDLSGIQYYIHQFDQFFFAPDSYDISQSLLETLRNWLGLATPWQIYLKTLLALKSLEEIPETRLTYKKPVDFQKDVIARLLRQIEDYNGALLVASTGLGKTVIATDVARRLKISGIIDNVLIVGPEPVRSAWVQHLRPVGMTPEFFNHSALDVTDLKRNKFAKELDEIIDKELDHRWLVIIDESHELRNRYKKKWKDNDLVYLQRKAFDRLHLAFSKSNCKILLLTATPYAKDINNINNQLYLLPHTSNSHVLFPEYFSGTQSWKIVAIKELKESPPVSVITTPYVARYYGVRDDTGIHLDFNGTKQFIPKIILYSVNYPIQFEAEMTVAFENHCFKRKSLKAFYQGIENTVRLHWASSPLALKIALEKTIIDKEEGGYAGGYMIDKSIRESYIKPIIEKLLKLKFTDDQKLKSLIEILKEHVIKKNEKVIIFVERHATSFYLENAINQLLPSVRISSATEEKASGKYGLKHRKQVDGLIFDFAPIANRKESINHYDVFITTDAYGVGVNLQDASVIINYDLAWIPVDPDQRAGRILRFWSKPRINSLYAFIPTFKIQSEYSKEAQKVRRRWANLINRHEKSKLITDLPTITTQTQLTVDMPSHAGKKTIEKIGEIDVRNFEENIASSEIFQHTAMLVKYREQAKEIPDDILSAKTFDGDNPIFYTLLNHNGKFIWVLYDVKFKRIFDRKKDIDLLDLINAEENTPIAAIDPIIIERIADKCIHKWCQQNNIKEVEVLRICSMLMVPEKMDDFNKLLS